MKKQLEKYLKSQSGIKEHKILEVNGSIELYVVMASTYTTDDLKKKFPEVTIFEIPEYDAQNIETYLLHQAARYENSSIHLIHANIDVLNKAIKKGAKHLWIGIGVLIIALILSFIF